jgi:hypothetical protein
MRRLTLEAIPNGEVEARPENARFIVATNAVLLKRVESE